MIVFAIVTLIAAGAGYFFTKRTLNILAKRAQLDIPNERSMHQTPVPRGGGIAVVSIIAIGMAAFIWMRPEYLFVLLPMIALALVSLCDDRKSLSAKVRLCAHMVAAIIASFALPAESTIFGGALPLLLDRAIFVLGLTWFINLYNFMDGIDGITGIESISIALGAFLVLLLLGMGDGFLFITLALVTGACIGFLIFNWHPAKIFLGDVGSVPLGFLLGFVLAKMFMQFHLWAAFILPLYYLADSGITIIKRALHREKIWQAHRQHFYQRAAQGLKRHDVVSTAVFMANISLIGASMIAVDNPGIGAIIGCVITAILLLWMQRSSLVSEK